MRNPEIDGVFEECSKICDSKNNDYADKDDFYKNFRLVEAIGLPMWVGIVIRFLDKFSRLTGFVKRWIKTGKLHVEHECIEDTFLDAINYLALGLVTYRKWKNETAFTVRCKTETDNNDVDKPHVYSMSQIGCE